MPCQMECPRGIRRLPSTCRRCDPSHRVPFVTKCLIVVAARGSAPAVDRRHGRRGHRRPAPGRRAPGRPHVGAADRRHHDSASRTDGRPGEDGADADQDRRGVPGHRRARGCRGREHAGGALRHDEPPGTVLRHAASMPEERPEQQRLRPCPGPHAYPRRALHPQTGSERFQIRKGHRRGELFYGKERHSGSFFSEGKGSF